MSPSGLLDATDRALIEAWLTPQDGESPDEYATALAVRTVIAIRVPTEGSAEDDQ